MRKLDRYEFIWKAIQKHGYKYDYREVEYINAHSKNNFICQKHGIFSQENNAHLNGQGCPICNGNNKYSTKDFVDKANIIHENKYDYSKTKYVNVYTKICIICPEHGEFYQTPHNHLSKHNNCGCPKCNGTGFYTKEDFIKKAMLIHHDKYDYTKAIYKTAKNEVKITCPIHGDFYQKPTIHLMGCGCPICNESKLEKNMRKYLNDNNIPFEYQKRFPWLGKLSLDFYLPELNIGIECQGEQHFKPIDFAGKGVEWAENSFLAIQTRDSKKKELCLKHGIELILYY